MQLTKQQLNEAQATFRKLSSLRKVEMPTPLDDALLIRAAETLISVYSQYCDLGDLTDEDLEGLE